MQSRRMSMVEACVNTAVGFGLSYLLNALLHAALGLPMSAGQNMLMTGAFTVLSLGRGYILRRLFNRHRATHYPKGAVSVVNPQGTEETGIDRPAAPAL